MKKLDRFILREIISDGAAGTVYLADEVLPGEHLRTVALKVLPAIGEGDAVAQARFFSEVGVLAQLSVQPNIVTIYAMGISVEGYPWLAMEYAEGTAAHRIYDDPGDANEVRRLIEQVSRGLLVMHSLQPPLIHQDLKPANILSVGLAGGNGEAGVFKITDFSLATVVAANRTHGLATVRYAAPELLSAEFGRVGPATDLYSLGHIAYEMALGNRLHRHQFKAVFEGNTTKEPPPNKWMMWHASGNTVPTPVAEVRRDFPADLSRVIEHLMAKSQAQRFGSAAEVLNELANLSTGRAAAPQGVSNVVRGNGPAGPPPLPMQVEEVVPQEAVTPPPVAVPRAAPPKNSQAAANANMRYWVRLRGRITGPFDTVTLQRQIRQGQLSRLHQVSADQVTWKAATEVEGLYGPTVV